MKKFLLILYVICLTDFNSIFTTKYSKGLFPYYYYSINSRTTYLKASLFKKMSGYFIINIH